MNLKKVEEFYNVLCDSDFFTEELQKELQKVHDTDQYKSFLQKEILPIAKTNGYDISVDDIISYENIKLKELNINELENVVGGKIDFDQFAKFIPAFVTFAAAMALSGGTASAMKKTGTPTQQEAAVHQQKSTEPNEKPIAHTESSDSIKYLEEQINKDKKSLNTITADLETVTDARKKIQKNETASKDNEENKKLWETVEKYPDIATLEKQKKELNNIVNANEQKLNEILTILSPASTPPIEITDKSTTDTYQNPKFIEKYNEANKTLKLNDWSSAQKYKCDVKSIVFNPKITDIPSIKEAKELFPNLEAIEVKKRYKYDIKTKTLKVNKYQSSDYKNLFNLNVQNLILGDDITTLANSRLVYLPTLKIIKGKNITHIGSNTFYGCQIKEVYFPKATEIDAHAFRWCPNLKNITIPLTATCDPSAFEEIPDDVIFDFTDKNGNFITPKKMEKIEKTLINSEIDINQFIKQIKTFEDLQSKTYLGEYYLRLGQTDTAVSYLKEAYQLGSSRAALLLGDCFMNGWELSKNPHAALSLYLDASTADDSEAMIRLGDYYLEKSTLEKEETQKQEYYNQAFRFYEKEWEKNKNSNALVRVINYLPIEKSLNDYFKMLKNIVEKTSEDQKNTPSYADANFNLGLFYQLGIGTEADEESAVKCYKKAAKIGHAQAMNKLGMHYYELYRIDKNLDNLETAVKYWTSSAARGDSDAKANCIFLQKKIHEKMFTLITLAEPIAEATDNIDKITSFTNIESIKKALDTFDEALSNIFNDVLKYYPDLNLIFDKVDLCLENLDKKNYLALQKNLNELSSLAESNVLKPLIEGIQKYEEEDKNLNSLLETINNTINLSETSEEQKITRSDTIPLSDKNITESEFQKKELDSSQLQSSTLRELISSIKSSINDKDPKRSSTINLKESISLLKQTFILSLPSCDTTTTFKQHIISKISSTEAKGLLTIPLSKQIQDYSKVSFIYQEPKDIGQQTVTMDLLVNDKPLFEHYPTATDVVQANIGDCYFLTALMSIANNDPQAIMNAIRDNGDGTVTVRFYDRKTGQPKYYKIAKTVPTDSDFRDERNKLWVSLFEKAYVIHRASEKKSENELNYYNIDGGFAKDALCDITGVYDFELIVSKESKTDSQTKNDQEDDSQSDSDAIKADDSSQSNPYVTKDTNQPRTPTKLFEIIQSKNKTHYITCSFKEDNPGVYDHHAYAILGTKKINDKSIIIIRNPYGDSVPQIEQDPVSKELTLKMLSDSRGEHRKGLFALTPELFNKIFNKIIFVNKGIQLSYE